MGESLVLQSPHHFLLALLILLAINSDIYQQFNGNLHQNTLLAISHYGVDYDKIIFDEHK